MTLDAYTVGSKPSPIRLAPPPSNIFRSKPEMFQKLSSRWHSGPVKAKERTAIGVGICFVAPGRRKEMKRTRFEKFAPPRCERGWRPASFLVCQEEPIDRLIRDLGNPSYEIRIAAENGIVELGESALPHLERFLGADGGNPEIRLRAARARQCIRWVALEPAILADLSPAQRTLLAEVKPYRGFMGHLESDESLLAAFQPIQPNPRPDGLAFPDSLRGMYLAYIGPLPTGGELLSGIAAGSDDPVWRFDRSGTKTQIQARYRRGPDVTPVFVLVRPHGGITLDEDSIRWVDGGVRCLPPELNGRELGHILRPLEPRIVREDGRITAVLHTFDWAQRKPFPALGYLFINERFALFVVKYQ